jgi:hypothetical protein
MVLRNYHEEYEHLPVLAENLLKFPNSEFFLLSCTNEIFRSNELDQEIGVKLAEKLIDLDKNNSLYRYLKAGALLADRRGDNITSALDEINVAATYLNFYFPETKYIQRTVTIAEKASLRPALVGMLSTPYFHAASVRQIQKALLRYASRAFTDGEVEKGLLIDDAINSIGKNQLDAGYNEARFIINSKYLYSSFQFGHWSSPEALELQRADITEQRAQQNRFQFCPYVLQQIENERTTGRGDYSLHREPKITDERMIFAVSVAMYNGRMLFATAVVWLALVVICKVRGLSGNQTAGITALLSFAVASLCYFFLVNGRCFIPLRFICDCYFVHPSMMRPESLGLKYILDVPVHTFVFLICPVLAALLLWSASHFCKMSFWWRILLKLVLTIVVSVIAASLLGTLIHFTHERMDLPKFLPAVVFIFIFVLLIVIFAFWLSKFRLVRGTLAAMPLGVLTAMASPYAYVSQIPMILFVVICTLIVLNKPSAPVSFRKTLTGIFSSRPESAAIRNRAIKLLAPFIFIHWLLFVASVPTCAQYIEQLYSGRQWSYPKSDLATTDETSYQQVLARFDSNNFALDEFRKLIPLIMPQDLPSVLSKCKKMSFDSIFPWRLKSPVEHKDVNTLSAESNRREIKLRDGDIITAMQGSGRDVVNILADAMENPERESVLVIRAKLGDVRVKAKLEELLASRLANGEPPEPNEYHHYWDSPAKTSDIICGLACISEPNEAGARFLDYVARGDVSQLATDHEFFGGVRLLPTTQAREVIKAYLAKTQDWQPPEYVGFDGEKSREDVSMALWPIGMAGTYDDKDIAEAVLKIMLRSEDEDIIKDWDEPWEAPQDFNMQSADLLRQGLASKNEQLRAWCVWQLRKVGYQFSEEEMSRLLADESWKVRANAVVAGGRKTSGQAAKDPNPFVRWVASLSDGGEN